MLVFYITQTISMCIQQSLWLKYFFNSRMFAMKLLGKINEQTKPRGWYNQNPQGAFSPQSVRGSNSHRDALS